MASPASRGVLPAADCTQYIYSNVLLAGIARAAYGIISLFHSSNDAAAHSVTRSLRQQELHTCWDDTHRAWTAIRALTSARTQSIPNLLEQWRQRYLGSASAVMRVSRSASLDTSRLIRHRSQFLEPLRPQFILVIGAHQLSAWCDEQGVPDGHSWMHILRFLSQVSSASSAAIRRANRHLCSKDAAYPGTVGTWRDQRPRLVRGNYAQPWRLAPL